MITNVTHSKYCHIGNYRIHSITHTVNGIQRTDDMYEYHQYYQYLNIKICKITNKVTCTNQSFLDINYAFKLLTYLKTS